MITKLAGVVNRVLDEELRLQVGPVEYQLLLPEFVRRTVQSQLGQEVSLHTTEYLEGNPMQGKMVPRLIGFTSEIELEFFDLFCTVDKVGVKKAMKALVRPIRDIADAIHRQDSKWLTSLPGIGAATAEQIVATLRRKITKFALMAESPGDGMKAAAEPTIDGSLIEDAYQALLSVGHGPHEARQLLDRALAAGAKLASVEEILMAIYKQSK